MLTGKQVAALSELLHACRDDWEVRGIQAALRSVDDTWAWPAICTHAITVAANARNLTPATISRPAATTSTIPVDHGQPCPDHNGTIRRPDGTFHCCVSGDPEPVPFKRTGVNPLTAERSAEIRRIAFPHRSAK